MTLGATYVHCIVDGAVTIAPSVSGMGAVNVLVQDGLSCVVSDGDGVPLNALTKEELVRRLLAHQRIIEQVMQDRSVLPFKFGTTLAHLEEASDMLSQGREQFLRVLATFRDKVEIDLAATWDLQRVLRDASQEPEVVRARESLARTGQPTIDDKLRLGQLVKSCLDRRRDSYRQRMVDHLRPLAMDVAPHPLVSDQMVMNVAFLLEKARQAEFDEGVGALDQLFNNEITFRVIGPLPPYSFATVEVAGVSAEQLEEAKRALGLGDVISEAEVRKAYRHAAAHLQRATDAPDAPQAKELARLRQASDLLLAYCRSGGGAVPAGRHVFFVTIRGPENEEVDPSRYGQTTPVAPARV